MGKDVFRKGMVLGIIVLFLGASVVPSISGAILGFDSVESNKTMSTLQRGTLYVGGGGPNNYTKIQDAIDDAEDGDTVFVYNDSSPYYENVAVNKSITLIGEDKNTTVIDGGGSGIVVYISANRVNFNGFTVRNASSKTGIGVISSYNKISGNIIRNSGKGIVISSSFGNIIAGNTIFGSCNPGIKLSSSHDNIVTENILPGWHFVGIDLYDSCNNIISGNNLSGRYYRGIKLIGIIDYVDTKNNVISENIISRAGSAKNISGWGGGIFCYEGMSNTFSKNEISSCSNGIRLITFYSNIKDNIISNNEIGIDLRGAFNSVSGNIIKENRVGLDLSMAGFSNIIWKNSFRKNSDGISLYGALSNTIRKNNFYENTRHAYFEDSLANIWERNYWDGNVSILYIIKGELNIYFDPFGYDPNPILTLTWYNFDLFPAQEPYDIGV